MADPVTPTSRREPGLRDVLIVAAGVVVVVLGLAFVTSLLPAGVQDVIFQTPLMILVLIGVTGWWLWRVSRRSSGDDRS